MMQARAMRPVRGFTLLEVTVAAAILAIALVGLLSVLASAQRLQEQNRETTLAMNAIRDKLEELRNFPNFAQTGTGTLPFAQYYAQTGNNPITGVPWNRFQVAGLHPDRAWATADDANGNTTADPDEPGDSEGDGIVGRVLIFTNESDNSPDAARVGLPGLDLDNDGSLTTANVVQDVNADNTLDYNMLPVTVRVEWRSGNGSRALQLSTLLARRR